MQNRYFRRADGYIECPGTVAGQKYASNHPELYTEVADAQGNPLPSLNPGSGNGQSPTIRHTMTCHKLFGYDCDCGAESATIAPVTSSKSKTPIDEENERLIKKVIPPFRGEAVCRVPQLKGFPLVPYFINDEAKTEEARRVLKRWISTTQREWAICRHSREPLELRIEGRAIPEDPYGGEQAVPYYYCPTCGVYGK